MQESHIILQLHIYLYLYLHTNININVYKCIYTNAVDVYFIYKYIHLYINHRYLYIHKYVSVYNTHTYMCVCMCVCMYISTKVVRHISFLRLVQFICLPSYKNVSNTFNLTKPQFPHQ